MKRATSERSTSPDSVPCSCQYVMFVVPVAASSAPSGHCVGSPSGAGATVVVASLDSGPTEVAVVSFVGRFAVAFVEAAVVGGMTDAVLGVLPSYTQLGMASLVRPFGRLVVRSPCAEAIAF